ncbi:hypothetical protein D3C86_2163230 [compost metagenome]
MASARSWDKPGTEVTLYAQWTAHDVNGTVVDDDTPAKEVAGATIRIVKGIRNTAVR